MNMEMMGRSPRVKKRSRLRSKTAAGVLALSILLGAGAIFAGTDAGQQLRAWFEKLGKMSEDEIVRALNEHVRQ
ncbi:hypothetical protein [Paenibacillus xerothermodurans]|uniref:Uncharacterized protein n=1 Tax=Paenibacillus xerothermodurans TaxID=1977292 RepID=A0A2W1NBA1_PAEXE|nr:hypothetical protein [Paenibacillus xerothermodurans]PZE20461.1 hypothetical protein CBW46_013595 [Paenibacillus xerothermodurans]